MLILINLDSALARRAAMEAQLQAAGLAAERVGIDLRGVARDHAREMARLAFPAFRFGGLLSAPEIGCWLSHLTAWQRAIDARVPACTVVEDDVVLQPHFAEAHRQLTREALHDVAYLGTSSRNISMRRPERCGPFHLHRPIGSILNTWGYVVRTEFAARFLAAGGPVTRPIDHVIGGGSRRCRPGVAVLLPPAVRENAMVASESQIAPFTGRPDRAVLVEELRRKFLSSRLGDAYYAAVTRLF
ncbi:MAG: glycosyltransferase family 25 protein [Burkholderiaceae bacterium]